MEKVDLIMEKADLRNRFEKETGKPFNIEWIAYNDYVHWLEVKILGECTNFEKNLLTNGKFRTNGKFKPDYRTC